MGGASDSGSDPFTGKHVCLRERVHVFPSRYDTKVHQDTDPIPMAGAAIRVRVRAGLALEEGVGLTPSLVSEVVVLS